MSGLFPYWVSRWESYFPHRRPRWHYRVRKRLLNGESWFDIVEYYENPTGWTMDGMTPGSLTREGLLDELERMLSDAKKYEVLEDKQN